MRWLWIDRFTAFTPGKFARAVKNLTLAEEHFGEHFPGYPVMPASLILEGLAQTGGILVGEANQFREKVILAKITSARFHREALAGEVLTYETELLTLRPEGASILGKVHAQVDGAAGAGDLLCEAEIFFAHLDQSRSQQIFGDHNFVFSGNLKSLLGLNRIIPAPVEKEGVPG